jgi:murein DD-endopeptidase MepM/ murein hydrolase activator NlpD
MNPSKTLIVKSTVAIITILMLMVARIIFASTLIQAQSPATSFDFPFGDETYDYGPILWYYGDLSTIVEDTRYGIKNPDLGIETTCFGQPWHNVYHAGEDWYRFDKNTGRLLDTAEPGNKAIVKSVGNGIVVHLSDSIYPGHAVVIEHTLVFPQDGHDKIYSVYMHLADGLIVSENDKVEKGTPLGTVLYKDWNGTNPDPTTPPLRFSSPLGNALFF